MNEQRLAEIEEEIKEYVVISKNKALELTTALRAERQKVAELQKTEWISVDDQLPDKTSFCNIYHGIVLPAFYDNGKFYLDDVVIKGVTHWMPLPKPPIDQIATKI